MKTLKLEDFKANTKEWFLEQLGNMSAPQALQTISDLYDELHKPKYPKTYEECVRIAKNIHGYDIHIDAPAYMTLMESFIKLLICRDAYWKIAGEKLGLDKPWEPDNDTEIYNIYRVKNTIRFSGACWGGNCNILEFPTEEMRDAFFENFKELIENCKELL